MKNYLFVVRSYNDLDQITPLIDYISRNNHNNNVFLFSSVHPETFKGNECQKYLKSEYGIELTYLLDGISSGLNRWFDGKLRQVLRFIKKVSLPRKLRNPVGDILSVGFKSVLSNYEKVNDKWEQRIIDRCKPDIILYDWVYPARFPYTPLTSIAKQLNIPIVALPHGIQVYTHEAPAGGVDKSIKQNQDLDKKDMNFDYQITQNNIGRIHLQNQGVVPDKIIELGSLRYERDWLQRYPKLYKGKQYELNHKSHLKIVIFPSKLEYKVHADKVRNLVKASLGNGRSIVIKPHTRGMTLDFLRSELREKNVISAPDTSSFELIKWCDVAIVWGSSIGLQVLGEGKQLIYPQFVHEPLTYYNKYLPDCLVNSIEELNEVLMKLEKNTDFCLYTSEQVDKLFRDIVYAGDDIHSVAKRHIDFFNSIN